MDFKYLIPKKGVRVLDPATHRPLPEDGTVKPLNTYWHRRLADGDVSIRENKTVEQPAAGSSGDETPANTGRKNSGEAARASSGKGSK